VKRQELAPELAAAEEMAMSVEAYEQRMAVPPSEDEVEELAELVRWFVGRYPTAKERFAYVRRKYAEWTRRPPAGVGGGEPPNHP
jgi:hypothetical protein